MRRQGLIVLAPAVLSGGLAEASDATSYKLRCTIAEIGCRRSYILRVPMLILMRLLKYRIRFGFEAHAAIRMESTLCAAIRGAYGNHVQARQLPRDSQD